MNHAGTYKPKAYSFLVNTYHQRITGNIATAKEHVEHGKPRTSVASLMNCVTMRLRSVKCFINCVTMRLNQSNVL